MKKLLTLVMLLVSFSVFGDTQISWEDLQKNIDSWVKGPVSLLLTPQEKDVYKKLKTPEEKMQFIKIFWARRDPILRTRENEFKEEFYRRVDYVNQNFTEEKTPGWETARGQVYIAFGPPQREEKRLLADSSRPALLWVYNSIKSDALPANEAILFLWRDFKYVVAPPNPNPGDAFGAAQRQLESNLRYQTIPNVIAEAFSDVASANVVDEKKDYRDLLYSVKSTERFGLAGIQFEPHLNDHEVQIEMKAENIPIYDDGQKVFAELQFQQQLKRGDVVVAGNQHTASYSWDQKAFEDQKQINVTLPKLDAPSGEYELWITVQDRISNVSETRKLPVNW
ncbi:MAG: hypothetical protein C5B54_04420 [Acidobacteria bacterium]|nr:MAG: hypothetical protein C5B54_04420 [Acidobacteriota bacterium]